MNEPKKLQHGDALIAPGFRRPYAMTTVRAWAAERGQDPDATYAKEAARFDGSVAWCTTGATVLTASRHFHEREAAMLAELRARAIEIVNGEIVEIDGAPHRAIVHGERICPCIAFRPA